MNFKKTLVMTGLAALMAVAGNTVMAQDNGGGPGGPGGPGGGGNGGRGFRNMDPAEMQQRILDSIHEQMGVTNSDEWKVIEQRVQKVMDARRDAGPPGFARMFGRRGNNNGDNGQGGPPRRGGMFGGTPLPELEALNSAIDNKAPAEQIKSAMDKYRVARKAKEAALEKAQQDLKSVLTAKQEAVALSLGLVN